MDTKIAFYGTTSGMHLPSEVTLKIRVLSRHRQSLIETAAGFSNKMQKALRLMNLRLDVVLNDITGLSGTKIIEAILNGERDGEVLSQLVHNRVRKTKQEIADALQGQWNEELLYELESCYMLYKTFQESIAQCDRRTECLLEAATQEICTESVPKLTKKQLKGKNQQKFNLPLFSYKMFGVDLFAIEGVSTGTIMTFIAEIGHDIVKFKSAKQFTCWLRLAPNNKISVGKLISSRTPKGSNKFALALRNAANTIDRLKGGVLNAFFKRIAYKKGRAAAITATARKIAVIIWNMVSRKQAFTPPDESIYAETIRRRKLTAIKKMMKKYDIASAELSMT